MYICNWNTNMPVIHFSLGYIKDCSCLIKFVLRCLYIEDGNRFMFLTEINNWWNQKPEFVTKLSEWRPEIFFYPDAEIYSFQILWVDFS
jgi:hypothetical protein